MNEQIIQKAEQSLKFLAEKLGVATTEFWPTFIRKQVLDAVTTVIWCGLWLTAAAIFVPICFHWPPYTVTPDGRPQDSELLMLIMRWLGAGICLGCVVNVYSVVDQIRYVFNLKYWALKDFLETLGNALHGEDSE